MWFGPSPGTVAAALGKQGPFGMAIVALAARLSQRGRERFRAPQHAGAFFLGKVNASEFKFIS